jgi:hypothetical protein
MSSQGTGADISREDASDLLHKLVTESIKVRAVFISGIGVMATVAGLLKVAPTGELAVEERRAVGTPLILFNPAMAMSHKYGDDRAFPVGRSSLPDVARHSSALCFIFRDGSQLVLFELAAQG